MAESVCVPLLCGAPWLRFAGNFPAMVSVLLCLWVISQMAQLSDGAPPPEFTGRVLRPQRARSVRCWPLHQDRRPRLYRPERHWVDERVQGEGQGEGEGGEVCGEGQVGGRRRSNEACHALSSRLTLSLGRLFPQVTERLGCTAPDCTAPDRPNCTLPECTAPTVLPPILPIPVGD